jgi:hypothetical protein
MSTVSTAATASPVDLKRPRAAPNSLKLEEHCRRRWWHKALPGVTHEDPLYEGYWVGISTGMTRHDVIYVLADMEDWELELRVERVTLAGAVVSVSKKITRHPIIATSTQVAPGFHSEYRGGDAWCIVREKDGHPVIKGHTLEGGAIAQWYREQPRAVA